jgi:hypothetical protein
MGAFRGIEGRFMQPRQPAAGATRATARSHLTEYGQVCGTSEDAMEFRWTLAPSCHTAPMHCSAFMRRPRHADQIAVAAPESLSR